MRARIALTLLLLVAAGAAAWWFLSPSRIGAGEAEEIAEGGPAMENAGDAGLGAAKAAVKVMAEAPRGRATILGTVKRLGVPVAVRVDVFALSRPGAGLPESWIEEGFDSDLPASGVLGAQPYASTTSAADGTYTIAPVEPGIYEVVAVAEDGAKGAVRVNLGADGAVAEANPEIRGGPESLKGKTVKVDGTPWKGFVAALPSGPWGEVSAYALSYAATGDDGSFTLAGLDRGRVSVVAFVDKVMRVVFRPVDVPYPAGELVLVVDGDFREVSGRVFDDRDGRPLSGVAVTGAAWMSGDRSQVKTRAVSDTEGKFKLPAPLHSFYLTTALSGYAPASRQLSEGQNEIELRLVKTARVVGRVTSDVDGSPLEGVPVYAVTIAEDVSAGARAVTGPDGKFEIAEVRPGTAMICVWGNGWYSKELLHARPQGFNPLAVEVASDRTVTVELVATKATSGAGKVLDAAGKGVKGARVGWSGSTASGSTLFEFECISNASRTATGDDGSFVADTLIGGFQYTFSAAAPGQTEGSAGPIEAEAGKILSVEIKLPPGRWLDATVLDESGGKPLSGATVQTWFNSNSGNNQLSAVTGPNGKARVGPLPPGDLWAMAQAPGGRGTPWKKIGKSDDGGGPLEAQFSVHRGHDIRGHLKYPTGAPVDDRNVYLQLNGPNTNWSTSGLLEGGQFEFQGLEAGSYRLEVKLDQSQPAVVSTTIESGDESVVITVPGTAAKRVSLTIVDGTGKPVPISHLLINGTESNSSGDTAYEGKFRLSEIPTEGWIEVYSPAGSAGTAIPWAALTVGPIPAATEAKEIKLEPEKRIEGFIHGPDGKGVRGVRVKALPMDRVAAFAGNDSPHDSTLSDADGKFRLGRLWTGDYKLLVEASEAYAPSEPKTVAAGSMAVDIALLSGFVAAVPIEDWQGRPLAKATVTATIEGRQNVRAVTDAAGVARLVGLDRARRYRLDVEPPNEVAEAMSLSLEDWKPSEEPVKVPRAYELKGVVRDRDGRLAGGARVTLVSPTGETNTTQTGGEGIFRFPRILPGDYRLFAATFGEKRKTSAVVTAPAGGADVALTLDPAAEVKIVIAGWPSGQGESWVGLRLDGTNTVLEWQKVDAATGTVEFKNLHPDATYGIYMRLDSDPTRIVYRRGITAATSELRVPLESGRSIRGRLISPRGTTEWNVWVSQDGVEVSAEVNAEGIYDLKGLPDGTYTLHASATLDGAQVAGTAEVQAGGSADIELKGK